MKRKILQYMADYIIEKLRMEIGGDERIFQFYLEMGMWLDFYAVEWFDIYLD
jgi:hypothetical protein